MSAEQVCVPHFSKRIFSMRITTLMFDLDGTLAPARNHPSKQMAKLFMELLNYYRIAIISGASYEQFHAKFLNHLPGTNHDLFSRLLLLPTTGSVIYRHRNGDWKIVEENFIGEKERKKIIRLLNQAITKFKIKKLPEAARQIDDRKSQVTLSGCGQAATDEQRAKFDPKGKLRQRIQEWLLPQLPEYDIKIGGATSIDVTAKHLNKAYAIDRVTKIWALNPFEILFIGDAIYPNGNDYSVLQAGIMSKFVRDEEETENWLTNFLFSKK